VSKIKECTEWLNDHQNEECEVYEEKKKELVEVISKYQSQESNSGPNIEEVD
jgi:septum formation topological specificity factor MinE